MAIASVIPGYFGKGSIEVAPAAAPGEGPTRRLAITSTRLVTRPVNGINTICDIVSYAALTHGTRNALGWRDVINIHEEETEVKKTVDGKEVTEMKKWKYFELSDYKYLNYIEVQSAVSEIARGLVVLGITTDHVFNIYAQTSVNWQLVSHACASISTPIATAYDTLGEPGLTHSINEPECIGIFTNAELLPTVLKVLPSTPSIKYIIFDGSPTPSIIQSLHATREGLQILNITDLVDLGKTKPAEPLLKRLPKAETLACIMYTSGSTGPPKGVCITHANLVASVGSVYTVFGHHFTQGKTYLAYLPLAHVLEYIVELCALFHGVTCGYARAKTLTDAAVRGCVGDLSAFRPNIMFGVPTVWETIRKGIVGKISAGGMVKSGMFYGAVALKKAGVPILSQIADAIVLSKVRAATGGQLIFAMNGGAPISSETQEFMSLAMVPMMQGYGMTESCGMCALLPPELMQYGSVGLPVPSVEIKFIDVPDAGYLSSNTPYPQGEVCLRGPSVTKGYYKRPDLNEDPTIFTKDGWLRTGDVGQWNPDGTLTLIDRIKNLIKLQNGEYIALERLESIYKSCAFVANVCVHATPGAKQPIAIIIPHEPNLRAALPQILASRAPPSTPQPPLGPTQDLAHLCRDQRVVDFVLRECNAVGTQNAFSAAELLHAVVLTPEEWTPESGLVTAAQKIQRGKIANVFEKQIKEVYV